MAQYNMKNPAVKRLMREAKELHVSTEQYHAQPLEDNLFEWHFTIQGPVHTEFHGGIYHGRIILPAEYPMKPPSIILLTPNGRFETNKKVCLSISGHHPETWQPSWSIRTALVAIIGFLPTHGNGALGSLDYTADERKLLAEKSRQWSCCICGPIDTILKSSGFEDENYQNTDQIDQVDTLLNASSTSNDVIEETTIIASSDVDLSTSLCAKEESEILNPVTDHLHLRHRSTETSTSNRTVNTNFDRRNTTSFNDISLIIIWLIACIIGVLIARRLIYY